MEILNWQDARSLLEENFSPGNRLEERALHMLAGAVLARDVREEKGPFSIKKGTRLGPGETLLMARAGLSGAWTYAKPLAQVVGPKSGTPLVAACSSWLESMGFRLALPLEASQEEAERLVSGEAGGDFDLLVLAGGERPEPPEGSRVFFQGLEMEPGREGACWSNPAGRPVLYLPPDPMAAFVVLHLVALPGLLRLCGREGPFRLGRSPLRFSKVWPREETRIYPGRLRVEGGEAVVEHLAEDRPDLAGVDCLFEVPAGEWIRDGDPVRWAPVRDQA